MESLREAETLDCKSGDLTQIVNGIKESLGDKISSYAKDANTELEKCLKEMNIDRLRLKIGQPQNIGTLFQKQDAYPFAMITAVQINGETEKTAVGAVMMRAKNR